MSRSRTRSIAGCAVLALAAASPSLAITLGVVPAQPIEETPFTLLIGGEASCPSLDTLSTRSGTVSVQILLNQCPSLPQPFLLEVPIPPLRQGKWSIRVFSNGQLLEALTVNVVPQPFRIDLDPPTPQPGSPFTVQVTGSAPCPALSLKPERDGNLLTLLLYEDCGGFPTTASPEPFVIEVPMEPLAEGNYVVQVIGFGESLMASQRFRVSGLSACIPSETVLCLLQGRYRVEATWRTAAGEGAAQAHPESDNFGAFSLADPDRRELFVGLRDTCATPTRTVWVSAHGLTDAEVELTVTEVLTGEVRRYANPLGMRFAPVWDPMAFVCGLLGVGEEAAWHAL